MHGIVYNKNDMTDPVPGQNHIHNPRPEMVIMGTKARNPVNRESKDGGEWNDIVWSLNSDNRTIL